jgi:osmotically-inducible protein OsmY
MERGADEVLSWMGDNKAEYRRRQDRAPFRYAGQGPSTYKRSDARIEEDVNEGLTEDHHVDAREISVVVKGGEVTLNGTVRDRSQKRRAEDVADSVTGVTHVQNNLRIAG